MTNFELEESLRTYFMDKTKHELWTVDGDNDAGFSEEYVFWLEDLVLKNEIISHEELFNEKGNTSTSL